MTPRRDDSKKVWRYMTFGRFVWLLVHKRLWMSRLDQLGDAWEGMLGASEDSIHRRAFANSWTSERVESHAMWSIYCRSTEGIAIRTTVAKLRVSTRGIPVVPVKYVNPREFDSTAYTALQLAALKRNFFRYEKEYRVVFEPSSRPAVSDYSWSALNSTPFEDAPLPRSIGFGLQWDPGECLEEVRLHPGADGTFRQSVEAVVGQFAPDLARNVRWSRMATRPPRLR
jgi:hypothetical protein